jgi:glutamate racemase
MAARPSILIFDSGLGGLTVYREIVPTRPDADFIYLADDAAFPYGALDETVLIERLFDLLAGAIETNKPDVAVIACNTASTIALPALRKKIALPFVGTVPAIKPACAASLTRRVAVLGTEATVQREYTRALIREHGQGCTVDLVGSKKLAAYAEAELHGRPVSDSALRDEIGPCFRDGGNPTDTVVLACTHYPLLIARLEQVAPWPVNFIDPAPAIARRVGNLLNGVPSVHGSGAARAVFTSGHAPAAILARFGMGASAPACPDRAATRRFDTGPLSP